VIPCFATLTSRQSASVSGRILPALGARLGRIVPWGEILPLIHSVEFSPQDQLSGIDAGKLQSPSTAVIGLTAVVPSDDEKAMLDVGAAAILLSITYSTTRDSTFASEDV
jgi:hypothetical protein